MNSFALGLGLKRRLKATQKWAILCALLQHYFLISKRIVHNSSPLGFFFKGQHIITATNLTENCQVHCLTDACVQSKSKNFVQLSIASLLYSRRN